MGDGEILNTVIEWLRGVNGCVDLTQQFPWKPIGCSELNLWRIGSDGKPEAESLCSAVVDGRVLTADDAEWYEVDHDDYLVVHWDEMTDYERKCIYTVAVASV